MVLAKETAHDGVQLRGFFRLQVEDESGEIVGDSGWKKNQITNLGVQQYLAYSLGSLAGSKYISYAGIGEGTEPGAADTALESEVTGTNSIVQRASVARASTGSTGLRCTGTFDSDNSWCVATEDIANIGLFRSSTGDTIFAGNTFASTNVNTNQNANFTYDITFTPS
jgi:hypothetical protein